MYESSLAIKRSGILKTLNRAGFLANSLGIRLFELDKNKILQHAARVAGFEFRDEPMEQGLARLITSIRSDARLNTVGKLALKRNIQRAADHRFLVERSLAENPSIRRSAIRTPLFVIGMPRTGTSILQALLYRDPAHRSPLSWECLMPHPAPQPDNYADDPRVKRIQSEFSQLFTLVPDFRKKHYMEADSPQECVGITALNFTSFQYLTQCFIPAYHEWFANEADQVANLRWHKTFLQFLQSGGVRTGRWLLKSPVHLCRLRALFEVYPDARIVMTHRHPASIVPSVASLLTSIRSLYSDHEDSARTARENLQIWSSYFNRFVEDRSSLGKDDQIIDLQFEDFVRDPLGVVRSIYRRFGWELGDVAEQNMQEFLLQEQKDKHGRHEYSLEQFGLSEQDVADCFRVYLDFLDERTTADAA